MSVSVFHRRLLNHQHYGVACASWVRFPHRIVFLQQAIRTAAEGTDGGSAEILSVFEMGLEISHMANYTQTHAHTHTHIHTEMYIYMHVCVCVCVCVCVKYIIYIYILCLYINSNCK
jgi:hypothetical protein